MLNFEDNNCINENKYKTCIIVNAEIREFCTRRQKMNMSMIEFMELCETLIYKNPKTKISIDAVILLYLLKERPYSVVMMITALEKNDYNSLTKTLDTLIENKLIYKESSFNAVTKRKISMYFLTDKARHLSFLKNMKLLHFLIEFYRHFKENKLRYTTLSSLYTLIKIMQKGTANSEDIESGKNDYESNKSRIGSLMALKMIDYYHDNVDRRIKIYHITPLVLTFFKDGGSKNAF